MEIKKNLSVNFYRIVAFISDLSSLTRMLLREYLRVFILNKDQI